MSDQPQTQPTRVTPRKPRVYHRIQPGSPTTLCGTQIPAQRQVHGTAAETGRTACLQCETLARMELDLGW